MQNPRRIVYIWKPAPCSSESGRYAKKSIIDNSVITCDEIIETTKRILTKIVSTKSIEEI